jgi:catalase
VAEAGAGTAAMDAFMDAMAMHRHFGREMDPPLL